MHVEPQFVNSRDTVDSTLMRDDKGQKIGFYCDGGSLAWDKLTEVQKQAELSTVES
jgi:hypothetical protein